MIKAEEFQSEELTSMLQKLVEYRDVSTQLKEQVEKYFAEFDDDNNGYLDQQELSQFLTSFFNTYKVHFPINKEYIDEVFQQFDDNKDGKIQPDELENFTMHFVNKLIPEYEAAVGLKA